MLASLLLVQRCFGPEGKPGEGKVVTELERCKVLPLKRTGDGFAEHIPGAAGLCVGELAVYIAECK